MTDLRLILASASPARTQLLSNAGIAHRVLVSDVDEDAVTARYGITDSHDTALLLARAKAESVAALDEADGALVLGCDSVFEFDGKAYGKPYEAAVARDRLRRMSGGTGVLHTGHWLVDNRETADDGVPGAGASAGSAATIGTVASAEVRFAAMTEAEIDAYIATGEPLQVAGAFTLDSLGGSFITGINGDPHTVVGLSISTLRELLASTGVGITEFWT
ncbi:septum formation inhibitor Maf [Paeniglutamicibacter antarcticus]|uniref:Nucleoside triphosphate pyrophosphatase n=1 Tax=Arthrobacter terrae TaxID=2935737 RepID=A0A931G431_9MICC|nr:nucleoside triphosphate pyrophosphatase [Arthrobacter terrae]MBG0738373.1 septum formation inhibitor Maf [Arthrobacter terrae]